MLETSVNEILFLKFLLGFVENGKHSVKIENDNQN